MALDASKVPTEVVPLLPLAEEWGIGDDVLREDKVEHASRGELEALVRTVDAVDEDALYGWLAGPEANASESTDEYDAVTCLTMAVDSARYQLSHWQG